MRVADFIADFIFEELDVKHVFMVTGAGIMHLTDGVASHPKLQAICPHHEQTSSMAIDAYSRASENFGVGFFTSGPGGTNAVTGLCGAWQDSVPCLFISGQVKLAEASSQSGIKKLRQFGVQELDIIPIVESITKYAVTITQPEKIRYELEKAVYIAKSGRPGPVWIEIPMDVQSAKISDELEKFENERLKKPEINENQIKSVIELLQNAKRPIIISGQGVRIAGAIELLTKLVKLFEIPVVTPYLGIDTIRHDEESYIGKIGVKGERAGNLAMQNSDLILSIGSSLHVSVIGYNYKQFARGAKKIIIENDALELSYRKSNILDNESFKYDLDNIVTIVNGGYPDIRRVINFAQRQIVDGKLSIDQDNLVAVDLNVNVFSSQIVNVLKTQSKKDAFVTIRKMLADNQISDFADLFRLLYDEVDDYGTGHIAECILTIAKYQLSDAQVVDKEINAMAMLIELLGVIK